MMKLNALLYEGGLSTTNTKFSAEAEGLLRFSKNAQKYKSNYKENRNRINNSPVLMIQIS